MVKNKDYSDMPNINNDVEMENFNSQFIDRVNTIINQPAIMSEDDSVNVDESFSRPKKTARLDKTKTPEKVPIEIANKFGLLELVRQKHQDMGYGPLDPARP